MTDFSTWDFGRHFANVIQKVVGFIKNPGDEAKAKAARAVEAFCERLGREGRPCEELLELYYVLDEGLGGGDAEERVPALWPAVAGKLAAMADRRVFAYRSQVSDDNDNHKPRSGEDPKDVPGEQGLLSGADLAKRVGRSQNAVDAYLRRYRENYPDCAIETEKEGRRKTDPKYLYRVAEVLPALQKHFKTSANLTVDLTVVKGGNSRFP